MWGIKFFCSMINEKILRISKKWLKMEQLKSFCDKFKNLNEKGRLRNVETSLWMKISKVRSSFPKSWVLQPNSSKFQLSYLHFTNHFFHQLSTLKVVNS